MEKKEAGYIDYLLGGKELLNETVLEEATKPFTGKLLDMLQKYDALEANYRDTKDEDTLKDMRKILVSALNKIREKE